MLNKYLTVFVVRGSVDGFEFSSVWPGTDLLGHLL